MHPCSLNLVLATVMASRFPDHAANERTFLAWVRTAVAVVGFGLTAGRLGQQPVSPWSEVAMLASSGLVILLAYLRMRVHRKQIDNQAEPDDKVSKFDLLLVILIADLFVLMAVFTAHLA